MFGSQAASSPNRRNEESAARWMRVAAGKIGALEDVRRKQDQAAVQRYLESAGFALGEGDRQIGHKRLFSTKTLTEEIERAGYEMVAMEGLFLKRFTTSQILALGLSQDVLQAMMKVGVDYPGLCCALMSHARLSDQGTA